MAAGCCLRAERSPDLGRSGSPSIEPAIHVEHNSPRPRSRSRTTASSGRRSEPQLLGAWQRYSEAGAAARAEAVVAPQGRARPGCARSRQGTEFAGSRFRSSTVKFVPRHGRPNARRDLDHAAAARPRRSGHLIAAAIKRYSVSSIPGARPRRGRACATPWPSGGRALRLGGPPGCDELTYPRRCDRQPARSRRPAQPSLRVRADLRARAPASLLVARRGALKVSAKTPLGA